MPNASTPRWWLLRLGWRGLTLQLFFFVVLPLTLLLIVVAFGSLSLHQDAMRLLVGQRDERAATATAASIGEQLSHRASAIRALALYAEHAAETPDRTLADHAFLSADFDGGLLLATADGATLASSNPPGQWQGRPTAQLMQQVAPGESKFSEVFVDRASGEAAMMVLSVSPRGYVAVGAFSPARLAGEALAHAVSVGEKGFVAVVDRQGSALYIAGASLDAATNIARHPGVAEALRGESGTTFFRVGSGEHVVAYAPIAPVGWALLIEEPWEAVDSPLLRQTQAAPLILIPVLVIALVALGFGLRQIVQPLRALERRASQLAWGKFEAIEEPVGGIAEIRHLQAELVVMAQKLKAAQQNLRSYVGAITAGQEDERRRLARELHDGTVQSLIALDQLAQLAQMAARANGPDTADRLGELRQVTASLMEEVRRVIRALRPIYLEDLGLLPALEMLVADLEAASSTPAAFTVSGQPRRLSSSQEIAIYRIVQEALSNAARYASAGSVAVSIAFNPAEVLVRVEDDGQGFAAPDRLSDLAASGHYGLMGMHERAELIGAALTIRSAPGAGTRIELSLLQ